MSSNPDPLRRFLQERSYVMGILGCGILFLSMIIALSIGTIPLSIGDVWRSFLHKIGLADPTLRAIQETALWEIRVPRILLAAVVGGGLSIVGTGMQTLVRNPLAEPYILGVSSGAGAGASLYYLGFLPASLSASLSLSLAAFVGAMTTMVIVYLVARHQQGLSVNRLLLAGVAMAALMGAISTFILYASPELERMKSLMFWLLGSLASTSWATLQIPTLAVSIALILFLALAKPLDALLVGEEPAANLGVAVESLKAILILITALVTGALVAAVGAIGFVGLIVPHSIRFFTGPTHRKVIPYSFLGGALFLVWADTVSRSLLENAELPIGVVTAMCGVPFSLSSFDAIVRFDTLQLNLFKALEYTIKTFKKN